MEKSMGGISAADEITFAQKQEKIQIPVCRKNITSDLSEDFTIPDYLPEIRRLLRITPRVQIPSQYVNSSLAEFSGNVNWSVLYVSGDGDIASVELFSPYEVKAEYDTDTEFDFDGEFEAYDDIICENVIGRVTAPRKLNIRCRLNHSVKAYGERKTDTAIYGDATGSTIKRLVNTVPSLKTKSGVDDTVEIEENISLPAGTRAVSCDGSVIVNEIYPSNEGINCRGNVNLKIITSKDGVASTFERKIPFEATVPAELEGDGWKCRGWGKISDISIEQNENDIICRMHISVAADASKAVLSNYTVDLFSTDHQTEILSEEVYVPRLIDVGSFNFNHDGSADIEGIPENAQIIDSSITVLPESVVLENERYVLIGKCKYNTLYLFDGEYSARETEFPFRCELASGAEKPNDFMANVCVNSCRVRKEGENMAFGADMIASVKIIGGTPVSMVSEASFSSSEENVKSAAFTVAYPYGEETLWNIAKRYSVDPKELAQKNGIKSNDFNNKDILNEIKYLII